MNKPDAHKQAYTELGSLTALVKHLRSRLSKPITVPDPFSGATSIDIYKNTAEQGLKLLPSRYHPAYVNVLIRACEQAEPVVANLGLRNLLKRRNVLSQLEEAFKVLAAPVVQLQSSKHQNELKAYLAVASNLYQRFISDEQIRALNHNSANWPALDPLGFFTDEAGVGPYTVVPSREMPLSLISKPSSQMNVLPLWVLDGHEVGGHGIHSILTGFAEEMAQALEQAVADSFKSGTLKAFDQKVSRRAHSLVAPGTRKRDLGAEEFARHLARTFSLELAADMAGVLNFGPMFANGLMLYFGAEHADGQLSTSGKLLEKGRNDAHPSDVIRAMAAIEAVKMLDIENRDRHLDDLGKRLSLLSTSEASLHFSSEDGQVAVSLNAAQVKALVPVLVKSALTTTLPCLADRSLMQVLTWTDSDEEIVGRLSRTIGSGNFEPGDAEARHIVAASLVATEVASSKRDFGKQATRIHNDGIAALQGLYVEQCILCAVPTYARSRRTTTSLIDLLLRVKAARGE